MKTARPHPDHRSCRRCAWPPRSPRSTSITRCWPTRLYELLRRQRDRQLRGGPDQPVRQRVRRSGGGRRRHLVRPRSHAGRVGMRPSTSGLQRPCCRSGESPGGSRSRRFLHGDESGHCRSRGRVAGYIFILSTDRPRRVLYLGYASFFVLRQMCPLCLTMYVAVIGLFVVSGGAASDLSGVAGRVGDAIPCGRRQPAGGHARVVWVVASVSLVAFFPREEAAVAERRRRSPRPRPRRRSGPTKSRSSRRGWTAQPRVNSACPPTAREVVVVKFNDYQCPACRQAYLAYEVIQQKIRIAVSGAGGVRERRLSARVGMQHRRHPFRRV